MNITAARESLSLGCVTALLALCTFAFPAGAQKKTSTAAPAKPAAPAKSAPAAAAKPAGAGGAANHGASTASHGATATGGVTTASHGATTTGGVTTASHGATTATGAHSATAPNTLHPTSANPAASRSTATAGRPSAVASGREAGRVTPADHRIVRSPNGNEVRMRPNGRPAEVHIAGRNMDIHHGLNGGRRVEVERADHSRLVAEHGGRGYIERPYRYGDHEYARRSYYYQGRAYDHYYGRYYYRGAYVNYYTPAVYYRPAFYGWAYNPWVAPVPYAWGWAGNPWYGYYGAAYFTPYPVYASASLWLTDYLISTSLAVAYQARLEAAQEQAQALPSGAAGLTPDVKDLISAEVQRQIALENAEAQNAQTAVPDAASSSVQRMLSDNVQHIFVVGHDLDVVNSAGGECAVSQGDALQLAGPPPPDATAASLIVLSSKGGPECHRSDTVTVQIADLQEMQNHMRETIDAGMGELQTKQGHGLPLLPASAAGEPVKATFVSAAPPPESNVAAELKQQLQVADQAEKEAVAQAQQDSGSQQLASAGPSPVQAPPPPSASVPLSVGQTIDEVTAALGQPARIVDLGAKKIYFYKDMKVTFKAGKVSDVQ